MVPATCSGTAPVPPPSYHRALGKQPTALHVTALTLVTSLHLHALCRLAVQAAHRRCPPPLPKGPGGARRTYSEESLLLIALLRALWCLSYEDMRDWLRDWPALAVACGLPVGQDGRPRVPSPSQRWKRAAAAGAPPFERLFVLAVREALRLRLIGARDLIIDSAPILAWRRQDPDAASGHAPAHPPPAAATGVIKRQPRPSWRYAALASSASASTWDRIQARWRRRRGAGTSRRPGCGANGDAPVPGARPPLGAMGTRRGRGVEPERVDNRRGSGHGRRVRNRHRAVLPTTLVCGTGTLARYPPFVMSTLRIVIGVRLPVPRVRHRLTPGRGGVGGQPQIDTNHVGERRAPSNVTRRERRGRRSRPCLRAKRKTRPYLTRELAWTQAHGGATKARRRSR